MKLTNESNNLELPKWMKFGLELEVENLDYSKVSKEISSLNWKAEKDPSLIDNGTECVSPVLEESENTKIWEDVNKVCEIINNSPLDNKRESYGGESCGFHVHFDATELLKNPEFMKNFLRLYSESEEIIYKMCNEENEPIRPSVFEMKKFSKDEFIKALKSPVLDHKPTTLKEYVNAAKNFYNNNLKNTSNYLNIALMNTLVTRGKGFAFPIGDKIKKQLMDGKLKVGKPRNKIYREIITKNKLDRERYAGLNLTNLGIKDKNTIEFRIANGTKNPKTIKETVFLYASLLNTAYKMTYEPNLINEKIQKYYQSDLQEEEKADKFLELVMNEPEDREIFKARYDSVKDAPVFQKYKHEFGKDKFNKSDIEQVSKNVSIDDKKNAFNFFKRFKERLTFIIKDDEVEYGR